MIRVCLVISHFDLGGAERVAINIAKSKTNNIEYHLVEVAKGDSLFTNALLTEFKNNGIKYHRSLIKKTKLGILFFPFYMFWFYLKYKPAVIHCHTEIPDLSVFLWSQLFWWQSKKVKILRTIHNTQLWNDWKWIGNIVEKFFNKRHANISIGNSVRKNYENKFGLLTPIVSNGCSLVVQKTFPNLMQDKINILFAGRLEIQKGIKELINVVNSLSGDNTYFFHIVGDGTLKLVMQNNIINANVSFYNKIYGLSSFLASFDYIFMPSHFEGLALLSIEGSLAGTPVIINDCDGLSETLPDDWLLKVQNNDVEKYMNIFKNVLPVIDRNKYGNVARKYALSHFSIEKMQTEYEKYYEV